MAVEYLGLSAINGPLVVLEGVRGASYDEIVEMTVGGNEKKLGRIVEVYEDKAIIQVFEGTEGMGSPEHTHTSDRTSYGVSRIGGYAWPYLQRYRRSDRWSGRHPFRHQIRRKWQTIKPGKP